MKRHYIDITTQEFNDIVESGYEYPSVYVDGNGNCHCEESLYELYEEHVLQLCEII